MPTNTDLAGNTILFDSQLAWCLIGNSHQTTFLAGDQEFWEYVGVDAETALDIAQCFPEHWFDVEPKDDRFERAERHRREVLPRLAKASIPLPPFSSLGAEESRPMFNLLAKYNLIKDGPFEVETEYARYPFAILNEFYPPGSPHVSHDLWDALLGDLFRLLYRSGHGQVHPAAVKERIPKRWIIHDSPILQRIAAAERNSPAAKTTTPWNNLVRWLKHHLTPTRSR